MSGSSWPWGEYGPGDSSSFFSEFRPLYRDWCDKSDRSDRRVASGCDRSDRSDQRVTEESPRNRSRPQ